MVRVSGGADLYSVGAMLYEVLTGWPLFIAASEEALLQLQLTQPPPQVAGLPSAIGSLVAALLDKDPARRPQSTTEVLAALRSQYETPMDRSGAAGRVWLASSR